MNFEGQNLNFKDNYFLCQKSSGSFSFIFSLKDASLGAIFFYIFWFHQFLNHFINKMKPNFWQLATTLIQKFNNFFWVCWFLSKNLFIFVFPDLKLHNLYCHNVLMHVFAFLLEEIAMNWLDLVSCLQLHTQWC